MNTPLFLATILFMTLYSPALAFTTKSVQWDLVGKENGIEVSRRHIEAQGLHQFRGVGEVEAGIPELIALFADAPKQIQWQHGCVESKLVKRNFDPEREADSNKNVETLTQIVYGVQGVPWPLTDRDYILKSYLATDFDEDGKLVQVSIRAKDTRQQNYPPKNGKVRIPVMNTDIVLTPISETKTLMSFSVLLDPGGWAPKWIVDMVTQNVPQQTILNTRRVMANKDYDTSLARFIRKRIARMEVLRAPLPPEPEEDQEPVSH